MQLLFSTWPEIENYLKLKKGIIIPIGSVEQHGPTGLFGTDAICTEAVAKRMGDSTGALVSPTINVGMSVHHTAFPGSLSLRPSTLMQVIIDHVFCLARYGFERFLFVNGHGGNEATIKATLWEMYSMLPQIGFTHTERIRFKLANWYDTHGFNDLSEKLYKDKLGAHATPAEISIAMYLYPEETRKIGNLSPTPSTRGTAYGPSDFRLSFPDGRILSDPTLAKAEHGQRLLEATVDEMSAIYTEFMEEN